MSSPTSRSRIRRATSEYKALAPPAIAAHGGRYLARGGRTEVLEGTWSPKRAVILEFPSLEKAREWWASAEYAEGKALSRPARARTCWSSKEL